MRTYTEISKDIKAINKKQKETLDKIRVLVDADKVYALKGEAIYAYDIDKGMYKVAAFQELGKNIQLTRLKKSYDDGDRQLLALKEQLKAASHKRYRKLDL